MTKPQEVQFGKLPAKDAEVSFGKVPPSVGMVYAPVTPDDPDHDPGIVPEYAGGDPVPDDAGSDAADDPSDADAEN